MKYIAVEWSTLSGEYSVPVMSITMRVLYAILYKQEENYHRHCTRSYIVYYINGHKTYNWLDNVKSILDDC